MPIAQRCLLARMAPPLCGLLLALLPTQTVAVSGATCHLTVTAMDFGQYSSLATRPMDFTADVSVLCTAPDETPIPVAGSISLIADDASGAPYLESGRKKLRYQLFVDAARSVPCGLAEACGGSGGFCSFAGSACGPSLRSHSVFFAAPRSRARFGTRLEGASWRSNAATREHMSSHQVGG